MFITLIPKVLQYCFLIRWLNNFEGSNWIAIVSLSFQTLQPLIAIYRGGNFVNIIRDVNQYIGHCLIPLDPWIFPWLLQYVEENIIRFITSDWLNKFIKISGTKISFISMGFFYYREFRHLEKNYI